jgi:hypothetical protein
MGYTSGDSVMNNVKLIPLEDSDREQFILDNQEAFNYGALEEFGLRDDHFEEDEQIISRETIEKSIDNGEAYRIMSDGRPVGGVIISVNGEKGDLDILFTSPKEHSRGIGYAAWCEVEKFHPDPNDPEGEHMDLDNQFPDGMFRFEKVINGGRK